MFKLKVFAVEESSYFDRESNEKKKRWRVWFKVNGKIGWLWSYSPVEEGAEVSIEVTTSFSQDSNLNKRLALKIQ